MKSSAFTQRRRLVGAGLVLPLTGILRTKPAYAQNQGYGVVGQNAPELDVRYWIDGEGKPTQFSLREHHGKFIYVKCFQAWCPGCHKHGFPALQQMHEAFHDNDQVETVAIQTTFEGFTTNTRDKVREMQLRYDLPIVMGHNPGNPDGDRHPSTMRNFRTGGTPWMILIDPIGRVIFNDFQINVTAAIKYLTEQTS